MHAIVMAGGKGSRLKSYSAAAPKALLRFGDYTLLEIVLRKLRDSGAARITLCVAHLGEMIEAEFGTGDRLGVPLDYCWDRRPRGTAGPLAHVAGWESPALVMNCDVLTGADLGLLYRTHLRSGARLTIAGRRRDIPVDFGVLTLGVGDEILGIREKPTLSVHVAGGIYVVDPALRLMMPDDRPTDMPHLAEAAIAAGGPVRAHVFDEPWHDVGTPVAYERARAAFLADPAAYLAGAAAEASP